MDNSLQFLVSTNNGLKLVDDSGNATNYINSNSRDVEVYSNHIFVLETETIEEYDALGESVRSIPIPSQVASHVGFTVLPDNDFALYNNVNDKIYF